MSEFKITGTDQPIAAINQPNRKRIATATGESLEVSYDKDSKIYNVNVMGNRGVILPLSISEKDFDTFVESVKEVKAKPTIKADAPNAIDPNMAFTPQRLAQIEREEKKALEQREKEALAKLQEQKNAENNNSRGKEVSTNQEKEK